MVPPSRFLAALLLVVGALLAPAWPASDEIRVSVYFQWAGTLPGGRQITERPFFLVRDLDALTKLWDRLRFEEFQPSVDFEKCMVFVACPGPTLFDFSPMKVVGFFRRDLRYTILMDFDRRRTGGYWRNPFVVALLPRVLKGDIDVMRAGDRRKGEPTRVPVYTIWDMAKIRDIPLVPARPYQEPVRVIPLATYGIDLTRKPSEFVITVKTPKVVVPKVDKIATRIPPKPPLGTFPPPVKTPTVPPATSGGTRPAAETKPPAGEARPPETAPASGTASAAADPFGDAFNLDF